MNRGAGRIAVILLAAILGYALWPLRPATYPDWTTAERTEIASLSLSALPPPVDTGNAVADNPQAAVLGRVLFHDTRLSANGEVSCATCHQPDRRFTDGLQKGHALGSVLRNTPSIVGAAYSPWQFWDGRRDSLWSQALAPIEDPDEHAFSADQVAELLAGDAYYRNAYTDVFGDEPQRQDVSTVFANTGKAIAAFERTLMPDRSRFDDYADALAAGGRGNDALTAAEARGLRLFIGKANCTQCHNGPMFTNNEFHNTGVISFPGELPDRGRAEGVREVLANPYNCRGDFNDDIDADCSELEFVRRGPELVGAFKTPSLRNLAGTEPYMHKGQIASLGDVLLHYNEAPDAMIGHNEAKPLGLSRRERRLLEAFLQSLDAPVRGASATISSQ